MSFEKRQWLRLYADIVDDDKLGLLAFQDRWHYVAILALKAAGLLDDDCDETLRSRRIAYKLGITELELAELARRLSDVDLVDRKTIQPRGWDKRQFENDSSAERTKRWRERKKAKCDARECSGDVTVTPPDTDTDTDIPKRKIGSIEARATRLPKDWQPTAEQIRWTTDERPDIDAHLEVEKFRDYWHAKGGQGATKCDWFATWRNWIRNARGTPNVNPARAATAKPSLMQRAEADLNAYVARAET